MQKEDVTSQNESLRFFTTAHFKPDKINKPVMHKIPLCKNSRLAKKVPVEFVDQLLTQSQASDAPVFISRQDHTVEIYSFQGEFICELVGHKAEITAAKALSHNIIVSGDTSGELLIWDITPILGETAGKISKQKSQRKTHTPTLRLHEHKAAITSIEAITAEMFISISLDSSYKYWQTQTPKSLQTIVTKHPILSLVVMSPDDVIYCTATPLSEEDNINFHAYDIIRCNRFQLSNITLNNKKYSRSLFHDSITQIKLSPDGQLTFLLQSHSGNHIISSKAYIPLYAKTPAKILANGRYAFWDGKANIVINLYPLENMPCLSL
ncbi:MAG: hypothetical protein M3R00_00115 [Pseudomonadota bacterium]|nr:hypothetical protein [Pseudomonadota bacterium]